MSHVAYHISSTFKYTHTDMQDMQYVPIHGIPACIRLDMETIVHMLVTSGSHKQAWKPWLWNSPCTGKKLRPWKQESCWRSGTGLRTGVLCVNHPNNLSSSQHLPESKKKLTRQKKERLVCRQLHFTVIHHGAICDTFLILLLPFVVTSATS